MEIFKNIKMSLDVYIQRKRWLSYDEGKSYIKDEELLYDANITHNLNVLAEKAGIYEALWRPYQLHPDFKHGEDYLEELEFENSVEMQAKDIIPVLEKGLLRMKKRPTYFKKFEVKNGWGLYIDFVPFVEKYLEACKQYPESIIKVSR